MAKTRKTRVERPSPSSAEMVASAMAVHNVDLGVVAEACSLSETGLKHWLSGRRKPPSPAFCGGYRKLLSILSSLDRETLVSTIYAEFKLDPPNPKAFEEKTIEKVHR